MKYTKVGTITYEHDVYELEEEDEIPEGYQVIMEYVWVSNEVMDHYEENRFLYETFDDFCYRISEEL